MALLYLPGARWVGGRWVRVERPPNEPHDEFSGRLLAPTKIRGFAIPQGSRLSVDCELDLHVTIAAEARLGSRSLERNTELTFPSRPDPLLLRIFAVVLAALQPWRLRQLGFTLGFLVFWPYDSLRDRLVPAVFVRTPDGSSDWYRPD